MLDAQVWRDTQWRRSHVDPALQSACVRHWTHRPRGKRQTESVALQSRSETQDAALRQLRASHSEPLAQSPSTTQPTQVAVLVSQTPAVQG